MLAVSLKIDFITYQQVSTCSLKNIAIACVILPPRTSSLCQGQGSFPWQMLMKEKTLFTKFWTK